MRIQHVIAAGLLSLIALVPGWVVSAQSLQVESILQLATDLSASVSPRSDNNGRPCALVKVAFAQTGAEFEGNVIGPVEYKAGEYWVYMSGGTKFLKLKHSGYTPLMIRFAENKVAGPSTSVLTYDLVGPLVSKSTYMVQIGGLVKTATEPKEQKVTFRVVTPANATLMVDYKTYPLINGVAEIMLTPGDHDYTVFAPGYNPEGNKFMVYENNPNKHTIALEPETGKTSPQGGITNADEGQAEKGQAEKTQAEKDQTEKIQAERTGVNQSSAAAASSQSPAVNVQGAPNAEFTAVPPVAAKPTMFWGAYTGFGFGDFYIPDPEDEYYGGYTPFLIPAGLDLAFPVTRKFGLGAYLGVKICDSFGVSYGVLFTYGARNEGKTAFIGGIGVTDYQWSSEKYADLRAGMLFKNKVYLIGELTGTPVVSLGVGFNFGKKHH